MSTGACCRRRRETRTTRTREYSAAARPRALGFAVAALVAFAGESCAVSDVGAFETRDDDPRVEARRRAAEAPQGPGDEDLLLGVGELGSWDGTPAVAEAQSCGDCSGQGICDGTSCVCFDGFAGRNCEASNGLPPPPAPAPAPTPATPVVPPPSPQVSSGGPDDGAQGIEDHADEVAEDACPPLTAPGMAGVRCYTRLHPEVLPLGVGGGSCLCFILLLGCAAMRRRQRKQRCQSGGRDAYGATSRDSQVDSSFEDTRRSKPRRRGYP
jgi:hypothetical protein